MAEATQTTTTTKRQDRVQLAGEIIDRLDIAKHLIMAEPINCRLALALRILRQSVDDVADLAGACDERERRDRETIRRAAAPLPRRKRTILQRLDAVAFTGIVGLAILLAAAWIGASVAIRAGWL